MKPSQVDFELDENPVEEFQSGYSNPESNLVEPEMLSRYLKALQILMIKSYVAMNHSKPELSLKDFLGNLEKKLIDYSLAFSAGNRNHAAMILGVNPSTLCEKIKRYKLKKNKSDYKQYNILNELMGLVIHLKDAGLGSGSPSDR